MKSGNLGTNEIWLGDSVDDDRGKIVYDHPNDDLSFTVATQERLNITNTNMVINEGGNDYDFRVESDTNTHALFVDGGDSSVYIGKSDSSFGTAGVRLNVAGLNYNQFTRDGGSAVNINRLTSDGDLMAFYKDSTKVGSIGTYAGDIIIGTTDTGLRFDDGASAYIPWNTSTNSATDGTISLGATTVQYNNLYLSGTVTNDGSGGMSIDTAGNVTFNEGSIDADFRVESNNNTHALFVDGGNDAVFVGLGSSTKTSRFHSRGAGSGSGTWTINAENITGNQTFGIRDDGYMVNLQTYNATTASAENVHVTSAGYFFRSTSSRRYKNTINDATKGLDYLCNLRPVTFKGNDTGDKLFYGLIAEEVDEVGLSEFVDYNEDNQPDAVQYSRMVSLCIKAIQELKADNDALRTRIETLENA